MSRRGIPPAEASSAPLKPQTQSPISLSAVRMQSDCFQRSASMELEAFTSSPGDRPQWLAKLMLSGYTYMLCCVGQCNHIDGYKLQRCGRQTHQSDYARPCSGALSPLPDGVKFPRVSLKGCCMGLDFSGAVSVVHCFFPILD